MSKRVIGRHKAFLKAFARCGSITIAARAAKIDRGDHYDWLKTRAGYREEFAAAVEQAAQVLEDEAVERATKGVYEPNIYQGAFVYPEKTVKTPIIDNFTGLQSRDPDTGDPLFEEKQVRGKKPLGVWKKSDSLLMFLLRGLRPERYRERTEVTGKDGGPIESKLEVVFVKTTHPEDKRES